MEKKKTVIGIKEVYFGCEMLAAKMAIENYKPDLIIAVANWGLIGWYFLAKHFDCPIVTANVQSYTASGKKRNDFNVRAAYELQWVYKSVLLFDDLADSGDTLDFILKNVINAKGNEWEIRTATLYKKTKSKFTPDYYYQSVGKERIDFERELLK